MTFVGFEDGSKAIRYYDPGKRNIKISRNYAFNENDEPRGLEIEIEAPIERVEGEQRGNIDSPIAAPLPEPESPLSSVPSTHEPTPEPEDIGPNLFKAPPKHSVRLKPQIDYRMANNPQARPARVQPQDVARPTASSSAKATQKFDDSTHLATAFFAGTIDEVANPRNLAEAEASTDADEWKKAVQAEIDQLQEMGTWRLEHLPEGKKAIGNRWVFLRKTDEHGKVVSHKARLVALGCSQRPGFDYSENGTFAPVMRFETLRTMIALAAAKKWVMRQHDIKGAYLNGHITEELYMKQPEGFDDGTGRVCRMQKSLYGLVQAAHVWNKEFHTVMTKNGFTRLRSDYCAYTRRTGDTIAILLVWVDDIVTFTNHEDESNRIEKELQASFTIKSLGEPNLLLGIKVDRDHKNNTITLSQTHYIDTMLRRFNLSNAIPVATPVDPNIIQAPGDETTPEPTDQRGHESYTTAIGSLLYAAIGTRPDIAYAVNMLAQFTGNPQPAHWTAVKRVFQYLKGTRELGITYGTNLSHGTELMTYTDADWASSLHRKSISGYVVLLAGGAVAWSSKKQSTVALSTAEAEYIAATHVTKQILWQRTLFRELDMPQPDTSILYCDNQAAIAISHNPGFHARTKHIDIALYFLRDYVEEGTITLQHVASCDNLADIFTKGLKRPLHEDLTYRIGVIPKQGGVLTK